MTDQMESVAVALFQGNRKFLFGILAEVLLWVALMWAPMVDAVTRQAIVQAMWLVAGLVIGGNVGEHLAKRTGK